MDISVPHNRSRNISGQPSFLEEEYVNDGATPDRLKKAIERNRAKREKREGGARAPRSRGPKLPASPSFSERGELPARRQPRRDSIPSPRERLSPQNSLRRRRVGRQDDSNLDLDIKKERRLPAGKVDYLKDRGRKLSKSNLAAKLKSLGGEKEVKSPSKRRVTASKFITLFVKICWIVCFLAIARLLFSERGVVDYYGRAGDLKDFNSDNLSILRDNEALKGELERIKYDHSYQKKLVRDHLGYIASDEYLVIFSNRQKLAHSR